jgi:hypothetical protein
MDPVRAIADAVLYEGYVLWPYRRSALKNTRRWTFGGVYPHGHSLAHGDDPSTMRTECLLEGDGGATIEIRVRFLQVVERQVMRAAGGRLEPVDELRVAGVRHLTWSEAVEREFVLGPTPVEGLRDGVSVPIAVAAASEDELLRDADGRLAGALRRTWKRLEGRLDVAARDAGRGVVQIIAAISNATPFAGGSREDALEQTFCSTHTVLRADGAEFVSLTDPPARLAETAAGCHNQGTWPVLVGAEGERHTVLSSPIILEDHPRVAPESPGDLFDGGEIDQLLVLNILALTDEEKAEMRATDPKTRAILERTEALSPEELMSLHGAIREVGMARKS